MKTVLITGAAGFIGFHLSKLCLELGYRVIGIDKLSDYYDVRLKKERIKILKKNKHFSISVEDIQGSALFEEIVKKNQKIEYIVHLAAQAGVRHSIEFPGDYVSNNLVASYEVLELAKKIKPEHLLLASTSSVYGANTEMPFKETQKTDHPLSFYAATKKCNEVMAHSYSHIFDIPITLFRFFTVYGDWGRPDMALYKFATKMLNGEPIEIYNNGEMERDFTYVGDLVRAIELLFLHPPSIASTESNEIENDSLSPVAGHRICNIGNSEPVKLMHYIEELEKNLKITAIKNFTGMQIGDVPKTHADTTLLQQITDFSPKTSIEEGVEIFVKWFLEFNNK